MVLMTGESSGPGEYLNCGFRGLCDLWIPKVLGAGMSSRGSKFWHGFWDSGAYGRAVGFCESCELGYEEGGGGLQAI